MRNPGKQESFNEEGRKAGNLFFNSWIPGFLINKSWIPYKEEVEMVIEIRLKLLAAARLGCAEHQILSCRELPDGGVSVVAPSGKKFIFTLRQLQETAEKTMENAIAAAEASLRAGLNPLVGHPLVAESASGYFDRPADVHRCPTPVLFPLEEVADETVSIQADRQNARRRKKSKRD